MSNNAPFLAKMKSWGRNISGIQTPKKMPKKLQKSFQESFYKIKKHTPHLRFSRSYSLSSTTNKILANCKHPKTPSFTSERKSHHHNDEAAATLEDIDKFLIENFKSLYGQDDHVNSRDENGTENERHKGKAKEYQRGASDDINLKGVGILFDSPKIFTPPPSDVCGSHRFFISPVSSSSLIEEAGMNAMGTASSTSSSSSSAASTTSSHRCKDDKSKIPPGIEDCIALLTVSSNPYEDFRSSMQEMLDARTNNNQKIDWIFLEELLFCFLRLNDKRQYRFILSSFVDLVVTLRQNSSE